MRGLLLAITAYSLWGCFPLFFNLLSSVPPLEVLSHRVIWAWVFTAVVILLTRRVNAWRKLLGSPQALGWLLLSSIFIGVNWLVFIWAVNQKHVIEASLGYFITPLVSLLLGRVLLHEPLNRLQLAAAALAGSAVLYELVSLGRLPWVTLVLSCSFAFYGLIRKHHPTQSLLGLNIECLVMGLPALIYIGWLVAQGQSNFGSSPFAQPPFTAELLIASGAVTAIPLILFAAATAKLNLSVVGFIMYLTPTMQFLSAVFILNESYPPQRVVTFILIWLAMALFSWGLWNTYKKQGRT